MRISCCEQHRTSHETVREITGGTRGNRDHGECDDKHGGNTYGKTKGLETPTNSVGVDNHHTTTT
jgi:hypothetical protein